MNVCACRVRTHLHIRTCMLALTCTHERACWCCTPAHNAAHTHTHDAQTHPHAESLRETPDCLAAGRLRTQAGRGHERREHAKKAAQPAATEQPASSALRHGSPWWSSGKAPGGVHSACRLRTRGGLGIRRQRVRAADARTGRRIGLCGGVHVPPQSRRVTVSPLAAALLASTTVSRFLRRFIPRPPSRK